MSPRSLLTAAAYGATSALSLHLSSLLPERMHPGKRACRALRDLRDAPSGPYFARAVLESRWRSRLLLSYVLGLSRSELRLFFDDRVVFEGAVFATPMLDGSRPVILAAPHYGAAPVGYVAAVNRIGSRRPINLFYDAAGLRAGSTCSSSTAESVSRHCSAASQASSRRCVRWSERNGSS